MSTRSLTVFAEIDGEDTIACLYKQHGGEPEGWGLELCKFLADRKIIDGIRSPNERAVNGVGCLAAQVIAHFKQGLGEFYLMPASIIPDWSEYLYRVSGIPPQDEAHITISYHGTTTLAGYASQAVRGIENWRTPRVEIMRQTLEWYADEKNWKSQKCDWPAVSSDHGQRARDALRGQ